VVVLVLAGLSAGLAVALWLRPRDRPVEGATARGQQPLIAVMAPARPGDPPFVQRLEPAGSQPADPGASERFRARLAETYQHYLKHSVYPPWSRPADGSQTHLWQWNTPRNHAQAVTTDPEGREVKAHVELDRMFAGPGETLHAFASAWTETADGVRSPIEYEVRGEIRVWDQADADEAQAKGVRRMLDPGLVSLDHDIGFAADPTDPAVRRASITPDAIAGLRERPREAWFVAWVSAAGHTMPFSLSFQYAANRPLKVLGLRRDQIVDGSLVVTLDVEAAEPGRTLLQATLFAPDGTTPLVVFDDYRTLAHKGRQTLDITFFGRAIREAKLDGPYFVRGLHGRVATNAGEVVWASDLELRTARYKAAAFSDDEWWSDERARKADQYERTLNDLGQAAGSRPGR
jgi:hypothetical protein